jgi:uncharacterized protein YdeI (YjbR/CyaY-like superfamily)
MTSAENRSFRTSGGKGSGPEVPTDLAEALAQDPRAQVNFDSMSPSHRTEWVRWIGEAKRDETRARRIASTVASLNAGARKY